MEPGALVLTFFVRGGGNAASVMSVDCHVASMATAECHVALMVKWTNKTCVLAWVVAGVFSPVVGSSCGEHGEVW